MPMQPLKRLEIVKKLGTKFTEIGMWWTDKQKFDLWLCFIVIANDCKFVNYAELAIKICI
jgi:hypothetical protein